jgi:aryl-alcohol dehydrogenase-like predicted oxidoreductase
VPEGRIRTRLFSGERPQSRHGEAGCETQVFDAIDRIANVCRDLDYPMAGVAVAWLLHQPGVGSVIAGARRPDQIRQTAAAVDLALAPDLLGSLAAATEAVKDCAGPNPDTWQSQSRFR